MTEHERIWLQPAIDADPYDGRQWCEDKIWENGIEYVRADLALSASPAGVKPQYIGLKGASEIASADLASMSAIEPSGVGVETEHALYRFLVEGDVIRINDEFMSDDGATWVEPSGWEVGMEYPSKLFKSARRLVRAALKGDEQ